MNTSRTKILVVEDEPIIALDIKQRLTVMGYEVMAIADSSETALQAVNRFPLDLVLMDIRLRGSVSGIEIASQIWSKFNLPVVFVTAHADHVTLSQAKATQPFGYVVKPFENEDLVTAIETALSRFQAEMTAQRALQKEKDLNRLKSQFVSIVSHEFRTPLTIILVSLDLLEEFGEELLLEKRQKYFKRARTSIELMEKLLEEVLVIGEADNGNLQCHLAPVNLSKFCLNLVEELQTADGEEHLIMFSQAEEMECLPVLIEVDEKLLRLILTNLISNANKFSPFGSQVWIHLSYRSDHLVFQVQDQGIGIPESDQAQLFDTFYRGSNVNDVQGTGLGLSIVKRCIDVYGGSIEVESAIGLGTKFTVSLPCASAVTSLRTSKTLDVVSLS
jgi:signal transduction histidine kinase